MMSEKGTSLAKYVEHFGLEVLNRGDTYDTDRIEVVNLNRPDLQILGLFDYFDPRRIQVMGKAEVTYIMKMSETRRTKVFDDLFSYTIPALVLARNMECLPECLECARNHGRTLLRSTEKTADFIRLTMEYLSKELAPCITRHGVLLDIYGEGVMIIGDSGVGKSEAAIELIMRGDPLHRGPPGGHRPGGHPELYRAAGHRRYRRPPAVRYAGGDAGITDRPGGGI